MYQVNQSTSQLFRQKYELLESSTPKYIELYKLSENKKIQLYNNGNHSRDFTYISDIVSGIFSILKKNNNTKSLFNIFNIGNGKSRKLKDYLKTIEKKLNKKAKITNLPLQLGDIKKTHSDISSLNNYSNYMPKTDIEEGIDKFIDWYLEYYRN